MKKWLHKAETKGTLAQVQDSMRVAGEAGWELVGWFYASGVFHIAYKRPMPVR